MKLFKVSITEYWYGGFGDEFSDEIFAEYWVSESSALKAYHEYSKSYVNSDTHRYEVSKTSIRTED